MAKNISFLIAYRPVRYFGISQMSSKKENKTILGRKLKPNAYKKTFKFLFLRSESNGY
jgi:hypothetical protein